MQMVGAMSLTFLIKLRYQQKPFSSIFSDDISPRTILGKMIKKNTLDALDHIII